MSNKKKEDEEKNKEEEINYQIKFLIVTSTLNWF